MALSVCVLAGCSSGVATVQAEVVPAEAGVRLTITSDGKNTFSALGVSCEAKGEQPCSILLPAKRIQGGWNNLPLETKRRTDSPVDARFYVGEELFGADCDVVSSRLSPDPGELLFDVACRFGDGFHGEIGGKTLADGKGTVAAIDCLGDVETLEVDLSRPLLRGAVPLDVVNEGGGRLRRPLPVAVPAPVVQVSLDDWATPWFEETLPLRLRAEPGATLHVNGSQVQGGDGMSVTVPIKLVRGANSVRVEARRAGHAPAVQVLSIEGRYPDTPLLLDQTFDGPVRTTKQTLSLTGSTSAHAKLYLDGRPMEHRRGRFELSAYLEEGKNDLQLLAVVERRGDREPRPLTRIDIEAHRDGVQDPRLTEALAQMRAAPEMVPLLEVAEDPWEHIEANLRFPMRIEQIVENPSLDGSCSALIEGRACTQRVAAHVMVGWGIERSWVCVGEEVPVVVEYGRCLSAEEGDEVEVVGVVTGALGGRFRGVTVDRARINGLSVQELPRSERIERGDWPKPLPSLLRSGRR